MAKRKYKDSAFGKAVHIHANKPDDKFNKENPEFKVDLLLSGAPALELKEEIDADCEAAMEEFKQSEAYEKLKPKAQRELALYYPYEEVEDDQGNVTGDIIFKFKQSQKLRLKDGTTKEVSIGIYDAAGDEMTDLVRSGSVVRVRYATRAIPMPQLGQVGVRLDFMGIQVKDMAKGGGMGFGAVDGYRSSGSDDEDAGGGGFSPADGDGDY